MPELSTEAGMTAVSSDGWNGEGLSPGLSGSVSRPRVVTRPTPYGDTRSVRDWEKR